MNQPDALSNQQPFLGQEQSPTQVKIVDAAVRCVKRWGIEKVSLNDIAKEAGVTRPTVYSYFENRDDVIRYALLQSAYAFAEKALKHIDKFESPAERTIEAVIFALKKLPKEPYLTLITNPELTGIMNEHGLSTPEGQEILRNLFNIILNNTSKEAGELDEIAEITTRLMLSLLTIDGPKKRTEKQLRDFLQRRLLPALGL